MEVPKYVNHIDVLSIGSFSKLVKDTWDNKDIFTNLVEKLSPTFLNKKFETYDLWNHHHQLHAACAFYNSGFKEALCIIIDGMGSEIYFKENNKETYGREHTSVFQASYPASFELLEKHITYNVNPSNNLEIDSKMHVSKNMSPAQAFGHTAEFFGFHHMDAGKIMGLASYGKENDSIPPIYVDGKLNNKLFFIKDDLTKMYINTDNYPYMHFTQVDFQVKADFAYALQKATMIHVKQYILDWLQKTKAKCLCLSGGYFLNCVANYDIINSLPDGVSLYVEPLSSDSGTAMGAAKLLYHSLTNDTIIRKQENIYYGRNT